MFGRRRRRQSFQGLAALQLAQGGYAFAYVTHANAEQPRLAACEHAVPDAPDSLVDAIGAAVRSNELIGAPCVAVLAPGEYAVRQIEAPAVPDEELREAARWSLRELVDFEVGDAMVDVYRVPGRGGERSSERTFAVAAERRVVDRYVEVARGAGLEPIAVDITDMALRNVASRLPQGERGVCLFYLASGLGVLVFARQGLLYLVRTIDADLAPLHDLSWPHPVDPEQKPDTLEEAEGVLEALLLEAQRSLDFYEHSLGQDPIARLSLAPLDVSGTLLRDYLDRNLPVDVDLLDVGELLDFDAPLSPELQVRCLPVIGGALRRLERKP